MSDGIRKRWIGTAAVLLVLAIVAYAVFLAFLAPPLGQWDSQEAANFSEAFGIVGVLLAGLATLLVIWTIAIQREEMALQREEMAQLVGSQDRQLHMEILRYTIDEPELAEVWGDQLLSREGTDARQMTYINLIMSWWEEMFVTSRMSEKQAIETLNGVMERSSHFRTFWLVVGEERLQYGSENERLVQFTSIAQAAFDQAQLASNSQKRSATDEAV